MKKGMAVLLMNMLASEFGYKVEWTSLPEARDTHNTDFKMDVLCLDNREGDRREFQGDEKFEQAVQWLRTKL